MEKTKELLERFDAEEMFYFIIVSLFSADSCLTLEDCEGNLEKLKQFKEALPETKIADDKKEKYLKAIDNAIEVVEGEIKNFKKCESAE